MVPVEQGAAGRKHSSFAAKLRPAYICDVKLAFAVSLESKYRLPLWTTLQIQK